ncbi:MAG: GNAT family N-acetyltransferase [Eubacteriales bacterium]|nr:GNAT family N-acetyltransferase [Eubacteriales bacterium]
MQYRKSTEKDCSAVYRLICELEQNVLPYANFERIYLAQLQDKRYYCLVCERGGDVIGMLNLRLEEQLHHEEKVAEILEFSITEEERNKGVGKELFARACRIAQERGCRQMEVDCNQRRRDAHRFYSRQGMQHSHFKFSKELEK